MLAYHNDPAVKAKYQARFEAHRAADQVIQGTGYDNDSQKGCFIGCTLENYDHQQFSQELGWPIWLADLADTIFENLPLKEAPQFGSDLLDAVKPGSNLDLARVPFLLFVQRRNLDRLQTAPEPYGQRCRDAVQKVITYLEGGENIESAESAARSAWYAASAARSAVSYAAASAARSAASAVSYAAASAVSYAAASTFISEMQLTRDALLSIIRSLP